MEVQTAHPLPGGRVEGSVTFLRATGSRVVVASLSADAPSGHKEGDGDRLRGVHLLSHDPAFLGALPGTSAGLLGRCWGAGKCGVLCAGCLVGCFGEVHGCLSQEQVKKGRVSLAVGNQLQPLPWQPKNKQNPNPNQASGDACGLQAAL